MTIKVYFNTFDISLLIFHLIDLSISCAEPKAIATLRHKHTHPEVMYLLCPSLKSSLSTTRRYIGGVEILLHYS